MRPDLSFNSMSAQRCSPEAPRRALRLVVIALLCASVLGGDCLPNIANAQAGSVVEQLLEQARTFQAKGRTDKAADVYQKVLRSAPDQPEALEAVGLFHANAGRLDDARALLARLERLAPDAPGTRRLKAALSVGKQFDGLIDQARAQVHAGHLKRAVELYERAFGGAAPPERLALEYYQTLGGTDDGGWERAQRGLGELARTHPGDSSTQLAYARHLTYRERTRREGIDRLVQLARDAATRSEATPAWRQALLWLNVEPADSARLNLYLTEVDPADNAVRAKLPRRAASADPAVTGVHAGFAALDRAELDEAGRQFERAGETPEALVGLALVAMRKNDFELALKLLDGASARAPSREDLWLKPRKSAQFWSRVKQAERLPPGDPTAEALLREAITISAEESFHARVALARRLLAQGNTALAKDELDKAAAEKPNEPQVLRALVDYHLQRAEYPAAVEANTKVLALVPEQAWPARELEAEILRLRAGELHLQGDDVRATALLEEAFNVAPKRYWVAFDRANLAFARGEIAAAQAMIRPALDLNPTEPAGRMLQARIEAEAGHLDVALSLLTALPPSPLLPELPALRRQLELRRDADRILRARLVSGPLSTRRALAHLEHVAGTDPQALGIVALAWAEVGEASHGAKLLLDAIAAELSPQPGLLLELAAVYLRGGMNEEVRELIDELTVRQGLNARERRDLKRIHVAYTVASANAAAKRGEYDRALEQLEPLLAEYPDDSSLLCALGHVLSLAGEYREAERVFGQVLDKDPSYLEAREGAVLAALSVRDLNVARELVSKGLTRQPNQPRMRLIAARYELALDDDGAAMRELTRARALLKGEHASGALPIADEPKPRLDTAELLKRARRQLAPEEAGVSASEADALFATVDHEIERLREKHGARIAAEPQLRFRAGEAGFGRILELRLPVRVGIPVGYSGRVELRADAVQLSSGTAHLDDVAVATRFGALGAVNGVTTPRAQSAVGIAPRIGFAYRDALRLEVGTSPLGFRERRLLGLVGFRHRWGPVGIELIGERASVTDSLLSYAGTVDPLTGRAWGGVTSLGGSLELNMDTQSTLTYLVGGYYLLSGDHVADNRMGRLIAGVQRIIQRQGSQDLRVGPSLLLMAYDQDQYGFTLGKGGYFSPQAFVRGGVPLLWRIATDAVKAELSLDPGVTWFRTDTSPLYPSDPAFEAQRRALGLAASKAARENFGFSLNAGGNLRYQVGDHLGLGGQGSVHFANDYREYRAMAFLEIHFKRSLASGAGR